MLRQTRLCVFLLRESSSRANRSPSSSIDISSMKPRSFKYTDSLVRHLQQSLILHEPGRFVILQKPYGVPCLGFKQRDGGVFKNSVHNSLDRDEYAKEELGEIKSLDDTVTVADCIPQLSKILREPNLAFCTGLKRYVSGPLILPCGRNDYDNMRSSIKTASSYSSSKASEHFYQYSALVIVVGTPEESEGTMNGYASFQPVGNHKEYILVEGVDASRRQKTGKYAVQGELSWNTLGSAHDCSLIHIQFGKFARHLPRLMLSQMNCPILGDALYAQRFFDVDGTAVRQEPSRAARNKGKKYIPHGLLNHLKIGLDDYSTLPMFFHVWQTVLPKYGSGGTSAPDLVASSPPPDHFSAMVDALGLSRPLKHFWNEQSSVDDE